MIQNKIVVRYADRRLQKGITSDFSPDKEMFHVAPLQFARGDKPLAVRVADLKAVFFVKDFGGNPDYDERKDFVPGKPVVGRKIKVLFQDGELLVGTTLGYQPGKPGFFIIPADSKSNVERCFVVARATREVKFI
ncbi:MAG: hypothetical protein K4571_10245 [Deltaproteobacteria bacterium]